MISGGRRRRNEKSWEKYREVEEGGRAAALSAERCCASFAKSEVCEVRRDGRVHNAFGSRSQTRGPDGAWHSRASARAGEVEKSFGDCVGRQTSRGGECGRGFCWWRRDGREDQQRKLDRLRRA